VIGRIEEKIGSNSDQ